MSHLVVTLLNQLQKQMEHDGLWQSLPPAPEKMMSNEPFSIDTLNFLEWLQWVYIARLRALIDAKSPLPTGAQVYPYGEEALKAMSVSADNLLLIVKKLDKALAG